VETKLGEPRAYISGPISGMPMGNVAAFSFCADVLDTIFGWDSINPHNIRPFEHPGQDCPPGPNSPDTSSHNSPCHLKADIEALVQADCIVMLRGWEHSAGARLELSVAAACALPVWFFNNETAELHSADGSFSSKDF